MQTFSFVSQKGGVGKSTLARQFAVLAGPGAVLIDRDPQNTTTMWWAVRRKKHPAFDTPDLLTLKPSEGLTATVKRLEARSGMLFIDTRPAAEEPEAEAARVATLVVIPVGTSADDIRALPKTLAILERTKKPGVIVVNGAKNEARALRARALLSEFGFRVCPYHLTSRTPYENASQSGLGIGELKKRDPIAEAELAQVWAWVQEAAHG